MLRWFDSRAAVLNRRELLCAGAIGATGLSLPQLLRAETLNRPARSKSCIVIFALGGPAQHETFDMKPNAPAEVRGEFKPIPTNVPGISICEHLPRLARLADRFSIIRSANHKNRVHNPGSYYALTGHKPAADVVETPAKRSDWPGIGSILARVQPTPGTVPPYVVLPIFANDINIPTPGQHAGFLGTAYDPLIINADPSKPTFDVPALAPQRDMNAERLDGRRALHVGLGVHFEKLAEQAAARNLGDHYERAYALLGTAAAKKAFDLAQEPPAVRDRYGRNRHGQSVLLARRLVENGVRLVLVNDAEENGQNKVWDTHGDGFKTMRKHLPETDAAVASLLEDLRDRGLLDTTLVVWMGEFGRSPKVDRGGGRDHWPDCYSLVLAGGGIQGGRVHGSSDSQAAYPRDNACTPEDIHATIYHALGLPPETMLYDALTRPHPLVNGKPLSPLF